MTETTRRLQKIRRQQPIGSFVVNCYYATARLIVDVDGLIHEYQRDIDAQHYELLEALGLRFVRVMAQCVEIN